jgi:MFS family permease
MNFVFLIRLFEVTGSAISTSLLWVAYSLPAILFGPFASASLDLMDKRKVLIYTNLFQALTILIYGFATKSNIFFLYEVVFVYSLLNQFYVPSEAATLPTVLKKENLVHGNSLFFITQQGSLVIGFGLAGLLNSVLGFNNTIFLCSSFLFIAFISTLFLPQMKTESVIPKKFETEVISFFKRIVEGYDFIKGERKVLTPVLLLIGFQVTLQVMIIQFPALAKDILLIPLNSAGIYMLVPAGIGAIIGALLLPKILRRDVRKKTIIDIALMTIAVSLIALTFAVPLFIYPVRFVLSFLLVIAMGFGFVAIIVPSQTFLQESTPADLRGRVFGNFSFLVIIASVLPVVFSGSIVEIFGIRTLLLIVSIFIIAIFVISKKFGNKFLLG